VATRTADDEVGDDDDGGDCVPIRPDRSAPTEPFVPARPVRPFDDDVPPVTPRQPQPVPAVALEEPRMRAVRPPAPGRKTIARWPVLPAPTAAPVLSTSTAATSRGPMQAARWLEQRHLRVSGPGAVRAGQRFALVAELRMAPSPEGGAVAMRRFIVPAEGRAVAIDVHVRGGLRVLSDATYTLTLLPATDSDPARFELQGAIEGPARVTLRVFALPADYLGQVTLDIAVGGDGTGAPQTVESAVLDGGEATSGLALLEVQAEPSMRALTFVLRGSDPLPARLAATVKLVQDLGDFTRDLRKKLDHLAQTTGLSPLAVAALLEGTGADLWQRLLPPAIADVLNQHLDRIDTLMFVGTDDPLPWELLYHGKDGGAFLGDRVLLARWSTQGARRLQLGPGPRRYVLPHADKAPPAAGDEIAQIEHLVGAGRRIGTLEGLLGQLKEARFGLLHFAAHNVVDTQLPATDFVKLDQPFQQAMLGAQYGGRLSAQAPLVFMNACNSSAAGLLWTGASGWAGRFLGAGAGAFVGSLWQVRDRRAREFAVAFYAQLAAGQPLGHAFRQARAAVAGEGDPTRLGYTLYGHPQAFLQPEELST